MRRERRRRQYGHSGSSFQRRFESINSAKLLCSKQRLFHFAFFMAMAFALLYSLMIFLTIFNSNNEDNSNNNNSNSKHGESDVNINENKINDINNKIKNQMNVNFELSKMNSDKRDITREFISNKSSKSDNYEYIKFNGYIAPQQSGKSRGMFEQFEKMHDHNLVEEYCTALGDMCVGYAHNDFVGYQFYGAGSFPLTQNKGWNFYLKHEKTKINLNNEKKANALYLKGKGLKLSDADIAWQNKYKNFVIDDSTSQSEIDKLMSIDETKQDSSKDIIKDDNKDGNKDSSLDNKDNKDTKHENKNKKYISYSMNVGRINNQLYSFEAMIQYAFLYGRTLVIPWPRHRNHVMGLECGMWDYDRLRELIDVVLEHELPEHLKNYRTETPKECQFHKLIGKSIDAASNSKCEMIYLYEGDLGIFKFEHGEYDVLKYMIPAKYIRDAVENFLKNTFKTESSPYYRVGVHRRAMDEGGKDPKTGSPYVCRWISHGIHGDSRFQWLRNFIDKSVNKNKNDSIIIKQIYQHSCAMDFWDLQNILVFHKQGKIDYKNGEKYFIAHDHQNQAAVNKMKEFGGVEQPNAQKKEKYGSQEWTKSKEMFDFVSSHCKEYEYCPRKQELQSKEEILFDMWALYHSEFIVGTWASTLTRTVCHWKGFDNSIYNGNQCWLYWKWQKTANGEKNDWYTFDNLNYTALYNDPHEPLGYGNVFKHHAI